MEADALAGELQDRLNLLQLLILRADVRQIASRSANCWQSLRLKRK
jgi:hypothetical protein